VEEDIATLKALGLTIVQSKVYLALATANALTIGALSDRSKVPRTDLYRVIKELEQKGLVERIIAAPVEFNAISLKEGINVLINRKNQETHELLEKAENLIQSYSAPKSDSEFTDNIISRFILVPHTRVVERLRKAIDATQGSIDLAVSWRRFASGVFLFQEKIEESLSRKVKWRFIIERHEKGKDSFNPMNLLPKSPLLSFRCVSPEPETIVGIYDRKEVFVIERSTARLSESAALWSNSKSLLALATSYFEKLWDTAIKCVDPETEKEPI